MDAVNAFNHELFSLMDSKPPISRAKMISITKSAIKAMKLYKHVVQIVEKFIKKCKPEYKVAGLYVVDSIVRQSRHQFGADKDVFGPRFTKNITGTFENLCLCPLEDRSKIVRVLNLWQKNGVFKIEIIQPLLDMAAGNTSAAAVPSPAVDEPAYSPPSPKEPPPEDEPSNSALTTATPLQTSDAFAAVAQLFQSTQGQQLQQMLQNFQQKPLNVQPLQIPQTLQTQGQSISTSLGPVPQQPPLPSQSTQQSSFDKTLLDRFDYDDEPDAGEETKKEEPPPQPSLMQPPPGFLQHTEHFKPQMLNVSQDPSHQGPMPLNGQPQSFGLPPGQIFPLGGMIPPVGHPQMGQPPPGSTGPMGFQGIYPSQSTVPQQQDISVDTADSSMKDGKQSRRSHSGSRSPKRRRSRSNSRTRIRSRHRRSRSRERRHHSPRSRSQERRDREKERERRQKGLPPQKSQALSVCTTTLWVGQLDKRTQQQDVESLLEEFGQIESINMIPPRGCAYIVMLHRQDAYRALQKLSRGNYKVNQKTIKIAWALNKGIKADYKQYWDVDQGVTYIPWSKIKEEDLEDLKAGGALDIDSLAPEWTATRKALETSEEVTHNGRTDAQPEEIQVVPVITPAVPPVQIPPAQPTVVALGAVQPPVFPGPMGLPLPSFPTGVPPPFLRPGFNPLHMPPGFLPPGAMPLASLPSKPEDPPVDLANLGNRRKEDIRDGPVIFNHHIGPMGNLVIGHPSGPTTGPPARLPGGPLAGLPGGPLGGVPGVPPGVRPVTPNAGLLSALPVGLLSGPSRGPLGAPLGFPGGPPVGLSGGPRGGPPVSLPSGPPSGSLGGLPGGPPTGPLVGQHSGPPTGLLGGLPGGPSLEGQHFGPPSSLLLGPRPGLPNTLPPGGLHSCPPGGPPIEGQHGAAPGGLHNVPSSGGLLGQGPRAALPSSLTGGPSLDGQHVGPPGGGLLGSPPSVPRAGPPGNLHSAGGLLGARPGLIPLQRPPGSSPNMQRFPPSQGSRPSLPGAPAMPSQMMDRGPHPQMHRDNSPENLGFGMPPTHNVRGPFPPQGPPSFSRPGGPRGESHRGMDSPEELDGRHFRGERPGFRDREPERDWDRDRDRDRGFGGGRRSFGDGGRGVDRVDGRDRLSGWQEDGNHRGGWERDRGRDRDRERERDRDRERRDWRERRSSLDHDRDRGRDPGERERRDRGRGERGSRDRDRGRSGESKEGDRPRRSERRERTTRWDSDDRLTDVENVERTRSSDKPRTDRESSVDHAQKKEDSAPLAPKGEDSKTSAEPSNQTDNPEDK